MKSASEWLDDLDEHCYSANDGGGFLGFEAVKVIRAIQEDALKAAAAVAHKFGPEYILSLIPKDSEQT